MQKIVINTCYGGFGLSEKAFYEYMKRIGGAGAKLGVYMDRADPILVAVVEEMGQEADGVFAKLKVIEIPDDVDWQIEEFDGIEWVAEVHRTWR